MKNKSLYQCRIVNPDLSLGVILTVPQRLFDTVPEVGHVVNVCGCDHLFTAHHSQYLTTQPLLCLRMCGQVIESPCQCV